MSSKISLWNIVHDHIETFGEYDTGSKQNRKRGGDCMLFFILPAVIAGILTFFGITLSEALQNGLLNALSIFAGLLLNLLVLFHGMIRSERKGDDALLIREVLREIYKNISYSILVTLLSLVILMIYSASQKSWAGPIFLFVLYFLLGNFLLTLCMVLKRMHILLSTEFDKDNKTPAT